MQQKIVWMAAALASAGWAASGLAADTASQSVTAASGDTPAAAVAAKRVVRDKQTGKLRAPNEEELAAMIEQERAARAASGKSEESVPLVVRQYPNGMRSAVLGPDFLVSIKAQRQPDGKIVVSHDRAAHEHSGATPAAKE